MATCRSCEKVSINGRACHESGCPDAWRDEERQCKECGCDFTPAHRTDLTCSPCCNAAWSGRSCECDDCYAFSNARPALDTSGDTSSMDDDA